MTEVLKLLIKEAVLEALMEFANLSVAVASETEDKEPSEGGPIEPQPTGGYAGFSLDRP